VVIDERIGGELLVIGNTLGLSGDDGFFGYADGPGVVDSPSDSTSSSDHG
jgi:hypothetical protein